jgi:glycosyltransferase involved in cell wall biosynthesis
MKIAFIIGGLRVGGAERVITLLANKFSEKQDFQVTIITLTKGEVFYRINKKINLVEIDRQKNESRSILKRFSNTFTSIYKLNSILKKGKYVTVISFLSEPNIRTIIASKLAGIPKVLISERSEPNFTKGVWNILRNMIYPFADVLVVQNNNQQLYFKNKFKGLKIIKINNPVSSFKLNKIADKIHIVSIGRFDKNKNQIDIIDIFNELNLDCNLVLIGDGVERIKLENYSKQLKNGYRIKFLGHVKNIDKYLYKGWIFVSTSLNEGFPNTLLEAMSMGLAPIHYNCPSGVDEIIEDEINGYLIDNRDKETFKEKLDYLFNNSSKREEIINNAIRTREIFSIDSVVKEWEKIIQ